MLERGDISGKTGRTGFLHDIAGVKSPRVLVVGLGETAKFAVPQYIKAVSDAVRALRTGPAKNVLITLPELDEKRRDADWNLRQAVIAADHPYEYPAPVQSPEVTLQKVSLQADSVQPKRLSWFALPRCDWTRLAIPPNICNPEYSPNSAQIAADLEGFPASLGRAILKRSAWFLLAVARGSSIHRNYVLK